MDRSLKWRTLALIGMVLFCLATLAPSIMSRDKLPSVWPLNKLFGSEISLGLDLQGGLHIVYSIALDRAVDDRASDIKRDLEARFADEKVDAKVTTPGARSTAPVIPLGAVMVSLGDAKKKAEVESQIRADNGSTIEDFECPPEPAPSAGATARTSICFRVSTSYAEGIKKSALANAVTTIRERINEKGVSEPSVVEKGDQIIVELPGDPKDPAVIETRDVIAKTAKLEFKVVDNASEYMNKLFKYVGSNGNDEAPTEAKAKELGIKIRYDAWSHEEGGGRETDYFLEAFDQEREEVVSEDWAKKHSCLNHNRVVTDGKTSCRLSGRGAIERYLFGDKALGQKGVTDMPGFEIPSDRQIGFEAYEPEPNATDRRVRWRTYYLDRAIRLTGSAISNAAPSNDQNTGRPNVLLDFNRFGSRVFGDLTTQIVGKRLATILDDRVRSAPTINGPIRGGRASITLGGGDVLRQEREREELVNVLRTGSLPAPLIEDTVSEVGPTLGRDAIDKTKLSFAIGIVLVILIMVGVYRWSGWIAVFAVVFHIVMTLAVMAMFGATLTLPGVAAIVLSIGMEVDGNILIYERIRDELLLGKSVRGAIDLGFSRAFSAILDGQLTTAAAGWVLLSYGSGPIKGFAVMLLVGVFTTLTTNIWVTRIFFDWTVSRKKGAHSTISI